MKVAATVALVLAGTMSFSGASARAAGQSQVMGELEFHGATKVERGSGVWIDGQYVGFLKELKGGKKIVLLPGKHEISVRQAGYQDFSETLTIEPGQKRILRVAMRRNPEVKYSKETATLKLNVEPGRAAVFLDEKYVGHADEFGGAFRAMLVSPGKHRLKVELPGYRTFETEINLLTGQKSEIKTELVKGSIEQAGPLIKKPEK